VADIGPVVVAQASARIPRMVGASAHIQRDDEAEDYFNLRSCCAIRRHRAPLKGCAMTELSDVTQFDGGGDAEQSATIIDALVTVTDHLLGEKSSRESNL
jgi:hypothetical protein